MILYTVSPHRVQKEIVSIGEKELGITKSNLYFLHHQDHRILQRDWTIECRSFLSSQHFSHLHDRHLYFSFDCFVFVVWQPFSSFSSPLCLVRRLIPKIGKFCLYISCISPFYTSLNLTSALYFATAQFPSLLKWPQSPCCPLIPTLTTLATK